jgi:SAM-dependent methyltransferase
VEAAEGARTFQAGGAAYDSFMGRYSGPLATVFADAAGVAAPQTAVDVGCGPGALTGELVRRLGAEAVAAVDPTGPFVEACRTRNPGVDVRLGRAEELPLEDGRFDATLAQLVLHFVTDPAAAAREMRRVTRPGGVVGACVWDADGMTMLRVFREAVRATNAEAPIGSDPRAFGREGEIADLFRSAGLEDVRDGALDVETTYADFDEFWNPFLTGIGPAGDYVASLDADRQASFREVLRTRVGSPAGPFTLTARAWYATGRA